MDPRGQERKKMVRVQLRDRGICDERVLAAMEEIPRHRFVSESQQGAAYADKPLPIGMDQTISQPYVVAYMCEVLKLTGEEKILEIGTGSGYEAAVLSKLAREIYTVEILPDLSLRAREILSDLGVRNVFFRVGDGLKGWPEKSPFDAIVLSAAPEKIPEVLLEELTPTGKLVGPVGEKGEQSLILFERTGEGFKQIHLMPVLFVSAVEKPESRRP